MTLRRRLMNEFRGWLAGRLIRATTRLIGRPYSEPLVCYARNGEIVIVTHHYLRQTLDAGSAHRLGCKLLALAGPPGGDGGTPVRHDPRRPLPVPSAN